MTCRHAEEVFLDPAVQTRVSTFITTSELRTKAFKHIVGAVLEVVFENGVLIRDMTFDEVRANAKI